MAASALIVTKASLSLLGSSFLARAKHIDICHHFVHEQVANGTIKLDYCSTSDMTADIMTIGLARDQYCKLREKAGMIEFH